MLTNALFQQSFKAFPLASLLLKADVPNFTIIDVNAALLEVSNVKSASLLIGKSIFEAFPDNPNDVDANGVGKLKASLCKTVETGTVQAMPPQRYDIEVADTKRYIVKYWSVKNTPLLNEDGSVDFILHTTIDVTDSILAQQKEDALLSKINSDIGLSSSIETTNEIGSWDLDLETGDFYWSPEFFGICGYVPNAFIPSLAKALEIIHIDDHKIVTEAFNNAIEKGVSYRIEHRIITTSNQVAKVLATGFVTKNKEGKHIRLTGFFQNITAQKQQDILLAKTLEVLISSEKRYKQLFENNPSPMFIWDFKTLHIIDCNEEALLLYGYLKDEFLSLNILEISPKEDQYEIDTINESEESYYKIGKKVWRHFRKDGSIIHVLIIGHLMDYKGRKASLICLNDVTEKIKAEQALKESEAKYRSLFENAIDATMFTSPSGQIFEANAAACNMLQLTEKEICTVGRNGILDTTDQRIKQFLYERAKNGSVKVNLRYKRKNGELFECETSSTLYTDVNGVERSIITAKDITEAIKAEQALKESEARYKSFFENGINAHFICKANGDIIVANQIASNILGYSVAELCQMNRSQLADMSDPRLIKLIRDKEENGNAAGIHSMFHKNGRVFDVFIHSNIYYDASGEEKHAIIVKDLSELQQAEQALVESDRKYRLLFYQSPIPKWIYEIGTFKIIEVNDAALKHYGYSREEFLNLTILDLRPQQEVHKLFAMHEKSNTANGLYKAGKFIHKKKNGQVITVEISSIGLNFEDKICKLVIANDVTDVEYALKELALSVERYHYVTKATSDAIWDWDLENDRILLGDGFEDIFGYPSGDRVFSTNFLLDNVHPDDRQKMIDVFYNIVKRNLSQCRDEFRFKKADGSYAYVINKGIVIRNAYGRTIRIVGGMRDITKHKNELLRLQLLESVITNTSDMVVITEAEPIDGEGPRIIYVNDTFTKKTGYTLEETIGKTPRILQGPKTDRKELDRLKACLKTWQPCNITVINYTKTGEEFWVNMSISPVADANGWFTHWISVERDVTERVQHESEIIKTIIKTQEEERYEIGGELHDNVCQILTSSKIAFKMIEKSLPENKSPIFNEGVKMLNLAFKEIRNLSHRLAPAFFDDTTLEQAFIATLNAFNVDDNFKISLQFDDAFKDYPTTKEFQLNLHRILQEQLSNILKYAKATTITVEGFIKNNQLALSIRDDGIGFNSNHASTGIGLFNMKRRAELFNGKLKLDTAPGKGCKLTIEIPLKDVN